jgi:hypothetical protein
MQPAKISKKIYHFYKIQKQNFEVHKFSQPPLIVLPIVLCHPAAITVEATWVCDCITVYPKFFTHQSFVLPRKTSFQEIKWKYVVLDLHGFPSVIFSCSQQIHAADTLHSPYILNNCEFTVFIRVHTWITSPIKTCHNMPSLVFTTIWLHQWKLALTYDESLGCQVQVQSLSGRQGKFRYWVLGACTFPPGPPLIEVTRRDIL